MYLSLFATTLLLCLGHPASDGSTASQPTIAWHDFKMSICEISGSPTAAAWNLDFYLFEDDLKAALYGDPTAPQLPGADVLAYLNAHFRLSVDGRAAAPLQLTGTKTKEAGLLQFSCTLPLARAGGASSVAIHCDLMLEKFRNQTNMVYLKMAGKPQQVIKMDGNKRDASAAL